MLATAGSEDTPAHLAMLQYPRQQFEEFAVACLMSDSKTTKQLTFLCI